VPCVLSSATPSLESLHNALAGRYERLRLPDRATGRPMPSVQIVDLSRRLRSAGGEPEVLSEPLLVALQQVVEAKQQAILFLNRRGHATLLLCRACGSSAACPNCDVALTHHLARRELRCHYCDHREAVPEACPACGGELLAIGVGTERVEKTLRLRLPGARVMRLDRDAVTTSAELTRVLAAFARGEGDVLVGTQMVTKGHDFPGVTLVGVVLADVGLSLPDFRAAEHTFQLLAQVAGRAGRGVDPGRVIIQTFHPTADAITFAVAHDYDGFASGELSRREELGYPPFTRMLGVRVDAPVAADAERTIRELAASVRGRRGLRVLGPAPAAIPRLRGRYRFQLLLIAPGPAPLQAAGRVLVAASEQVKGAVRVGVDVDPVSML
jgi:primosomal protein N' (replication factor Y)